MEKFDKYRHTSLITKWWLEDSKLSALLKIDRGYKLPSDWINDLQTSNVLIFENGIGEIRDIFLGQKGKEAEIFYYSPSPREESNIAGQLIGWCLSRDIDKIRIKRLDVKEDIVTKESINNLISKIGANHNERMDNKNTDIPTSAGGYPTTSTATKELHSVKSDTSIHSASSEPAYTTTATNSEGSSLESNTNATNATLQGSSDNDIRSKKSSTKGKKKQSKRQREQVSV